MRIIFEQNCEYEFADLFSIKFVWILPIIKSFTPLVLDLEH